MRIDVLESERLVSYCNINDMDEFHFALYCLLSQEARLNWRETVDLMWLNEAD